MCGYIFCDTNKFSLDKLDLQSSLWLRGPDQENRTQFKNLYFHHFRLQIVGDLNQGIQPVESDDYILLFNGEIYNFRELAIMYDLSCGAYTSDTVCLFELFHQTNPGSFNSFLTRLIGHYFLYSKQHDQIYFMRDQMGVKPLYFSRDLEILSSDINTIASSMETQVSHHLLLENVIFGGLTGERTIYSDIFTCLPGILYSYEYKANALSFTEISIENNKELKTQGISEFILPSILMQMPHNVDYFTLVSSGIDSRLIKKLVSDVSPNDCYTLGLGIYENLEKDLCTDEGTQNLLIEKLMHPSDYYNQLMSYGEVPAHNNFFALSHIYAEIKLKSSCHYKVALVGEGADEYFGGYGRYKALSSYLEGNSVEWISRLVELSADLWMLMMNARLSHLTITSLAKSGVNISSIIEERYSNLYHKVSGNSLKALSLYDQQTNLLYGLKKQDVSSMLSSIEARTPYVNQLIHANSHRFLEMNSSVTKKGLRDYALINGIDQRDKIGFPVSISQITDSFAGVYYDKHDQLRQMELIFDFPKNFLSSEKDLEVSFLLASLFL